MVAEATLPRRSIPHLALQLGGLALLLVVAELLPRVTTFHDLATGVANAERIVAAERALGIYTEPEVAAFGAGHDAVATVGNVLYVALHVPVMAGALLWVYFLHPGHFPWLRTIFITTMVLTVVGYTLLPTAPPRFLPDFADAASALYGESARPDEDGAVNTLAAFPSGHVAFALVAALAPIAILRAAPARALWAAYPVFIGALVVVTAHHFWLDAAGGFAVVLLALLVANRVSPPARRP
jgi:membrane-associated phospholipid phosphatase